MSDGHALSVVTKHEQSKFNSVKPKLLCLSFVTVWFRISLAHLFDSSVIYTWDILWGVV